MEYITTVACCMCSEEHKIKSSLPEGWDSCYDGTDDELGFCPKHAKIKAFTESQCPGCVGGWTDCPLWKSFAYSTYSLELEDFESIRRGVCPKRVNGTFSMSDSGVEELDLRSMPSTEAGNELADAICEYVAAYHHRPTTGE